MLLRNTHGQNFFETNRESILPLLTARKARDRDLLSLSIRPGILSHHWKFKNVPILIDSIV